MGIRDIEYKLVGSTIAVRPANVWYKETEPPESYKDIPHKHITRIARGVVDVKVLLAAVFSSVLTSLFLGMLSSVGVGVATQAVSSSVIFLVFLRVLYIVVNSYVRTVYNPDLIVAVWGDGTFYVYLTFFRGLYKIGVPVPYKDTVVYDFSEYDDIENHTGYIPVWAGEFWEYIN